MPKLNDLPLFMTIKYIENVITEYQNEIERPENAELKTRIWDAMQQCRDLLKELNALKDFEEPFISKCNYCKYGDRTATDEPCYTCKDGNDQFSVKNIWK